MCKLRRFSAGVILYCDINGKPTKQSRVILIQVELQLYELQKQLKLDATQELTLSLPRLKEKKQNLLSHNTSTNINYNNHNTTMISFERSAAAALTACVMADSLSL